MALDDISSLDPAIQRLVADYFSVMHFQDMELFDRVFHKESVLYGVVDDALNIRPYAVYRAAVEARQSPAELGNARRDVVVMFDQVSPTLAVLKMELEMFGGVMQDYLNIVFLEGQWWVMAKMWEKIRDVE